MGMFVFHYSKSEFGSQRGRSMGMFVFHYSKSEFGSHTHAAEIAV
jgi:hypothetical protein